MSETITLGGERFDIRPLKLGQLRRLLDALEGMAGKSGGALIEAAAQVIAAGLAATHPDFAAEAVLELEATVTELNAAVASILRIAGLQPAGEAPPVASPGSDPEISSVPSTAPSPPAAATPTGTSTP